MACPLRLPTPPDQFPSPTRRADAERNRDRILAAARSAFVDPDAEASMAEVSRRAGVGRATLYRNSPGRRELLEALYTDEVNTICEGTDYLGGATIFCAWLARRRSLWDVRAGRRFCLLSHCDAFILRPRTGGQGPVPAAG